MLAGMLSACGQIGPLYMPKVPPDPDAPARTAPAPQSEPQPQMSTPEATPDMSPDMSPVPRTDTPDSAK
jgi:hypothetical protein